MITVRTIRRVMDDATISYEQRRRRQQHLTLEGRTKLKC